MNARKGPGSPDDAGDHSRGIRTTMHASDAHSAVMVGVNYGSISLSGLGAKKPVWEPGAHAWFENHKRHHDSLVRSIPPPDELSLSFKVLHGPPGIGKNTLLRQFVSGYGSRFAGGQFCVNCAYFTGEDGAFGVLGDLLRQVGISDRYMPPDAKGRRTLFRSLSPSGPVLVSLLKVTDAEQVEVALPNSKGSMVLVTTTEDPATLGKLRSMGASLERIEPFSTRDALQLLSKICGEERIKAEPAAAAALARMSGGIPDFLQSAGVRLELSSDLTIAQLVRDLAPGPGARASETQLSAVRAYDGLYGRLSEPARRLYRILGWLPLSDVSVAIAAVAAGHDIATTEELLAQMRSVVLLENRPDGRAELREPTRRHARRIAHADMAQDADYETIFDALIRWFLFHAAYADRVIIGEERSRAADHAVLLADQANPFAAATAKESMALADAWVVSERFNMIPLIQEAERRGRHEVAWQLTEALTGAFYYNHRPIPEWITASKIGIQAAQRCGSKLAEARLRLSVSRAYADRRDIGKAHDEVEMAMSIANGIEGRSGWALLASVHEFRGRYLEATDPQRALYEYDLSRQFNELAEEPRGAALAAFFAARLRAACALPKSAELEQALAALRTSAEEFRARRDNRMAGRALIAVGMAEDALGREEDAVVTLEEAVGELHDAHYAGEALETLADIAERSGDTGAARNRLRAAREIYDKAGHPKARDIVERLRRVRCQNTEH